MKDGAELIAKERKRQIEKEGWTKKHDRQEHDDGELLKAAICYARAGADGMDKVTAWKHWDWPWSPKWWKPEDRIRNLVKAGALIAAEIDRLQHEL